MLTKQDIAMLKTCRAVVFRNEKLISLFFKDNHSYYRIFADSEQIINFKKGVTIVKCCAHLFCYDIDTDVIRCIANVAKPGDCIKLVWYANCNTHAQDAGETKRLDGLTLVLQRGKKSFGFLVTKEFCDNNSARIIQEVEK